MAKAAIVGSAKLGAVIGTFIGGACMLYYGRQPTIALSGLFFVVGPALMAAFALTWVLIIGRLLIGLGIGISAVAIPAYLGEISPAKVRIICSTLQKLHCVVAAAVQRTNTQHMAHQYATHGTPISNTWHTNTHSIAGE